MPEIENAPQSRGVALFFDADDRARRARQSSNNAAQRSFSGRTLLRLYTHSGLYGTNVIFKSCPAASSVARSSPISGFQGWRRASFARLLPLTTPQLYVCLQMYIHTVVHETHQNNTGHNDDRQNIFSVFLNLFLHTSFLQLLHKG